MLTPLLLFWMGCSAIETDSKPAFSSETPPQTVSQCGDRSTSPDILFLTVDTLRADHLGYAGYESARTPNLDALAERGYTFRQATTSVPRTTPALGSLLTGLSPHRHGAREVGEQMTATDTIATVLQSSGWRTVGVSAIAVAGPEQNLDRGFESFDVLHDYAADLVTKHTLSQIEKVDPDCPLFLWVHYADPHFPYLPPARWNDQPRAKKCRVLGEKATKGKLARYRLFGNRNGMAEAVLDDCTALYDAEIAFTDHAIGNLFGGLKRLGRGNPIVAFTADHGENLGEWGLYFEHGPNVHDASLRVPLVLAGPGIPQGATNAVARVEDIAPTILSIVQPNTTLTNIDGRLLQRQWSESPEAEWILAESGSNLHARLGGYLVTGRKNRLHCIDGPRFALCKNPKSSLMLFERSTDPDLRKNIVKANPNEANRLEQAWKQWPVERTRQRVIRSSQFSLVANPQLEGGYALALYDHISDPTMTIDVQSKHPAIMQEFGSHLDDWHNELDTSSQSVQDRSEEQEEALRALGYIE